MAAMHGKDQQFSRYGRFGKSLIFRKCFLSGVSGLIRPRLLILMLLSLSVDEFCKLAREQHKYSEEQSLGMLFWHKHDMDRALQELANFAPFPDDWTTEDKVLFEQAFSYHGKSFHRIREMVLIFFCG